MQQPSTSVLLRSSCRIRPQVESNVVPKHAPGGKVDFHAARVTYINLVLETGVHPKEAQTLARHSTPEMTMNVYGRTRKENLSVAVEQVAKAIEARDEAGAFHVAVIGIAKGPHHGREGREVFHFPDGREKTLPVNSPLLFHLV